MEALVQWLGGSERAAALLVTGAFVVARIAPLCLLAPWLGLRSTPLAVRIAVGLGLAVAFTPAAAAAVPLAVSAVQPAVALPALARELVVGATFALATAVPFYGLEWAGVWVDRWRGATWSETTFGPSSPLGSLHLLMGVALFWVLGGHRLTLGAFGDALVALPVAAPSGPDLASLVFGAARLTADALAFGLAVAAPAGVALVMTEVTLGLIARGAAQLPLHLEALPIRATVGLVAVLLGMTFLLDALPGAFRGAVAGARAILGM